MSKLLNTQAARKTYALLKKQENISQKLQKMDTFNTIISSN